MPKRLSKPRASDDPAQAAFRVLEHVIERSENVVPIHERRRKNAAAVALGRKGGMKSRQGRMEKITPEERRRIASVAARARWAKEKGNG